METPLEFGGSPRSVPWLSLLLAFLAGAAKETENVCLRTGFRLGVEGDRDQLSSSQCRDVMSCCDCTLNCFLNSASEIIRLQARCHHNVSQKALSHLRASSGEGFAALSELSKCFGLCKSTAKST